VFSRFKLKMIYCKYKTKVSYNVELYNFVFMLPNYYIDVPR